MLAASPCLFLYSFYYLHSKQPFGKGDFKSALALQLVVTCVGYCHLFFFPSRETHNNVIHLIGCPLDICVSPYAPVLVMGCLERLNNLNLNSAWLASIYMDKVKRCQRGKHHPGAYNHLRPGIYPPVRATGDPDKKTG